MRVALQGLVALVACAGVVRAHDFWIEPSSFSPSAASLLSVRLMVGDHGHGDAVARDADRLERFVFVDADGSRPVVGREGADPAGVVRLGEAGTAVLGFRSRPSYLELDGQHFSEYLREEGLDAVLRAREERGEASAPGRERYSRCAKAIVHSGGALTGHDRRLGFPLELVPVTHPASWSATGEGARDLRVSLLWHGAPLPGALVEAIALDAPAGAVHDGAVHDGASPHEHGTRSLRTDADGALTFDLEHGGRWLIAAVHMQPVEADPRADWESHWASLSLFVGPVSQAAADR